MITMSVRRAGVGDGEYTSAPLRIGIRTLSPSALLAVAQSIPGGSSSSSSSGSAAPIDTTTMAVAGLVGLAGGLAIALIAKRRMKK